jgi:hypothetical protein
VVLPVSGQQPQYAFVLDQTDAAKAAAAIDGGPLFANRAARPDELTHASYDGVAYTDDETSGVYLAVVGHFVAITSGLGALHALVDVEQGKASSLASQESYRKVLAEELPGAAGVAYVPLGALLHAIESAGVTLDAAVTTPTEQQIEAKLAHAVIFGSARFNANGAAIDAALSGLALGGSTAPTISPIADLPAGSSIAFGLAGVGPALAKVVGELDQLGGPFAGFAGDLAALQQSTGLDLEADLAKVTTLGMFLDGTTKASVELGLVLGVKDPSQAPVIVDQLERVAKMIASSDHAFTVAPLHVSDAQAGFAIDVPGAQIPIAVAAGDGRIVAAVGNGALSNALSSSGRLGSSAAYTRVTTLLGNGLQPDLVVEMQPLVALLQNTGAFSGGNGASILGYLRRIGPIAIGTGAIDGSEHMRLVIAPS